MLTKEEWNILEYLEEVEEGIHFTKKYPIEFLEKLEQEGYISIDRKGLIENWKLCIEDKTLKGFLGSNLHID